MSGSLNHPLLDPGTLVDDRYEILSVLGEGGMAMIYEARHVYMERLVALKVLSLEPGQDEGFAERFLDEAKLAARIDHPNVATIHDFGFVTTRIGRRPYIAMARLYGHDLANELRQHGPLEPARAHRLVLRALDALACAHGKGIVHKDLKPENLFLTRPRSADEDIQLLDFGIAGLLDTPSRRTSSGFLAGTPQYLAPEYIESSHLSPALDVYQMGLILIEMITGRTVVDGKSPYEIMRKHCTGRLDILPVLREGELGTFFARALHHDHESRFANAAVMRNALAVQGEAFATLELVGSAPGDLESWLDEVLAPSDTEIEQRHDGDAPLPPNTTDALIAACDVGPRLAEPGDGASFEFESERATPRRRGVALALVVVLGVLLGIGAVFVLRGPGDAESDAAGRADAAVATKPATAETVTVPETAAATPLEVRFVTEPPGSRIVGANGTVLGTTPTKLRFESSDEVTVRFEHEGYEPSQLSFVPAEQRSVSTTLTPSEPMPSEDEAEVEAEAEASAEAEPTEPAAEAQPEAEADTPRRSRRKRRSGSKKKDEFVIIP